MSTRLMIMKKFLSFIFIFFVVFLVSCSKGIEISFDTDGGPIIDSITLDAPSKIERPLDPSQDGYIFAGWTLDGQDFNFDTVIEKSITLKANWLEAVSLQLSGPGIEEQTIMVPYGETYELPTLTRDGYKFMGWMNTANNRFITNDFVYEEDMFLEVVWEKKTQLAINYYNNSIKVYEDYAYEGDPYIAYTPSLEGYTFAGWYTDNKYTTEYNFNNLSRTNNIYCKFVPNKYQITFEDSDEVVSVTYRSRVGTLPKLSIPNCTFLGWEYEGQMIDDSSIYYFANDIKLTPVIQAKTIFYFDGDLKKTVSYVVGTDVPYLYLSKEGYIFAGWYDNSAYTGDAIYKIDTAEYAGKSLYAKWVLDTEATNENSENVARLVANYYKSQYNGKLVYENISMPSTDPYYDANLKWSSSNKSVLQDNGFVKRQTENKDISIDLTVTYGNVTVTEKIDLVVKGNIYKDIKTKKIVAGYVYTGTYNSHPVDDILLDTADIIYLAFATPNEDGTLIVDTDYLNKLDKFQAKAQEKGVRISLVIGGAEAYATRFAKIAADDTARAIFVDEIVNYITEYNLTGVDIDWEYPKENEKTLFTLLMKEIYAAVKQIDPEYLITAAIPAGPFGYPKYDLKNSINYMDYVNMMSYDLQCSAVGGATYHHCALYKSLKTYNMCSVDESVTTYTKQGVPLEKIIIGGAFYGRYSTVKSEKGAITEPSSGVSITYSAIKKNYLGKEGVTEYWDEKACVPYLFDSVNNIWITYENPKSIQAKCDYVVSKGVAGLMWWDYGSDSTGDLITAINEKLPVLKK